MTEESLKPEEGDVYCWGIPMVRKPTGYDLENHKIIVSRDVVFQEDVFPFKTGISNEVIPYQVIPSTLPLVNPAVDMQNEYSDSVQNYYQPAVSAEEIVPDSTSPIPSYREIVSPNSSSSSSQNGPLPNPPDPQDFPTLRRTTRQSNLPQKFKDFMCTSRHTKTSLSQSFLADSLGDLSQYTTEYIQSFALMATTSEPYSFQQAKFDPLWVEAMNQELRALEKN